MVLQSKSPELAAAERALVQAAAAELRARQAVGHYARVLDRPIVHVIRPRPGF